MEQLNPQQAKYKTDLSAINSLYNSVPMATLTNICAAFGLSLIAYTSVSLDMILDWSAVFLGMLLTTLFAWTIYNRKYQANEIAKTSSWVSAYIVSNITVSATLSAAYAYLILLAQPALMPFIALLFVTHSVGLVYLYSANKTVAIILSLFALVPVVTALALAPIANGFIYFSAITIGHLVSILIANASNKQLRETINNMLECEHLHQINAINQKRLAQTTIEDPLTQIYNRRFYELMIEKEIRRAKRANTSLSVAIIQIDCFEQYQEEYGNKAAEKCIRSVAKILSNATSRGGEFVARFGESTFALLAPNVKTDEAVAFTSKMLSLVAQAEIPHKNTTDEHHKCVSVSVGIAEFSVGSIVDVKGLLEQASIALKTANTISTNTIQVFAQNVISKDHPIGKTADTSTETSVFDNQAQLKVVGISHSIPAIDSQPESGDLSESSSSSALN